MQFILLKRYSCIIHTHMFDTKVKSLYEFYVESAWFVTLSVSSHVQRCHFRIVGLEGGALSTVVLKTQNKHAVPFLEQKTLFLQILLLEMVTIKCQK